MHIGDGDLRQRTHALAFAQIPSDDEITTEIRRTLDANGMRDAVHIRLTLTRGAGSLTVAGVDAVSSASLLSTAGLTMSTSIARAGASGWHSTRTKSLLRQRGMGAAIDHLSA